MAYIVVVERGGGFSSLDGSYIYRPGVWKKRRQGGGAIGVFKYIADAVLFCFKSILPYKSVIYECEYIPCSMDFLNSPLNCLYPEGTDFADSVLLTEEVRGIWDEIERD